MSVRGRIWPSARRILAITAWIVAALIVSIAVNLAGIYIFGNVADWGRWLEGHRWWFFAWRLCLYAGTICGWCWMRQRVRAREPSVAVAARLVRAEVAAIAILIVLELSVMLR